MGAELTEAEAAAARRFRAFLVERRNWGRWGGDDYRGTANLIDPAKRVEAARSVQHGISVSLARAMPKAVHPSVRPPAPNNRRPLLHYMEKRRTGEYGSAGDFIAMHPHGLSTTHVDALCHVWDGDGMWGGRDPEREVTLDGARVGGIEAWREGLVTRGVLLDVAAHRDEGYVVQGAPVTGDELRAVAEAQGTPVTAGDALVINCGREAWESDPSCPTYGAGESRPGLHGSCLEPIRDWDCSILVWDMLEEIPTGIGRPWTVHCAIFAFGLVLVDNARLDELSRICRSTGSYEFMLVIGPLWIDGATASPVNPVAIL